MLALRTDAGEVSGRVREGSVSEGPRGEAVAPPGEHGRLSEARQAARTRRRHVPGHGARPPVLLGQVLDHAAEVDDPVLRAVRREQVHVRLLCCGCDQVPTVAQVGRAAVPFPVQRSAQREAFGRLAPGAHLELREARVHAAAEDVLVVRREGAHDVVASRVERLYRPVGRERQSQIPDLARVVEGGGREDVRGVVAEAADVDKVLVDPVRPVQDLAGLDVVDGDVGRDAAGQEEVVGAVGAQRGELREGLRGVRAGEHGLVRSLVRVVLQEHDLPGVGGAAHHALHVALEPDEAQQGAVADRQGRVHLIRLDVQDVHTTFLVAHQELVRKVGVELKLPSAQRPGQQSRRIVRHDALLQQRGGGLR
mmetsp:Transcript_7612/g.22445  ORF Transcript_7612/g.22445 Transcript_7612/m.22445 type:complete len:366 (+) Transcript_7612:323-1420(+)